MTLCRVPGLLAEAAVSTAVLVVQAAAAPLPLAPLAAPAHVMGC